MLAHDSVRIRGKQEVSPDSGRQRPGNAAISCNGSILTACPITLANMPG